MKRPIPDVLRRGFENALANWQLLLIRLGEAVLFAVLVFAAILLAILPILVSIGVKLADLEDVDNIEPLFESLLARWTIIFWILGGALVLAVLFLIVHSFVEAGSARVYVDGERAAGPELRGAGSRYRAFSMAKWWAGAVEGWWPVFWMYNTAWSISCLFLLVPLVLTILLALVFRENAGLTVGVSCLGLVVTALVFIPVAIATAIWMNRAIAEWAVRRGGARDTLRASWASFKSDFGRHLVIALVMFVLSIAGSMVIGSFSFFAGLGEMLTRNSGSVALMLMPVRIIAQVISMAFSATITGWFLACFCSMANEGTS